MESFVGSMPVGAAERTVVIPNIVFLRDGGVEVPAERREPPSDLKVKRNIGVSSLFDSSSSSRIVLYLGRLSRAKRVDILLKAWSQVVNDIPGDWVLLIVGDGSESRSLRHLSGVLALKDKCLFAPPTKDVAAYYRRANMFVIPSTFEGFGLVTAEALSRSLPVIGFSSCPGTNALIENMVNGVLVQDDGLEEDDPRRIALLADSIRELIVKDSLRLRLSQNAPGSVEKYSARNVLPLWRQLLEDAARDG
jgi:glycosyltransferase involved in cell wall biosynthesis